MRNNYKTNYKIVIQAEGNLSSWAGVIETIGSFHSHQKFERRFVEARALQRLNCCLQPKYKETYDTWFSPTHYIQAFS